MSNVDLRVDWCSHEAAKYAVEKWHYSGQTPNQKLAKLGVWENGKFIGVVLFGDGANNNMGKPYGLYHTQVCELVRVALTQHKCNVSQVVAEAIKQLGRAQTGLRLIVSYADPEHKHVGTIYQAGNWLYAGTTEASDEYIVNGFRMHGRALRSTRSTHRLGGLPANNVMEWARKVLDPDIKQVMGSVKHRYLYPLDRAMRKQIAPLAKPYPKREVCGPSVEGDTVSHQPTELGSIPGGRSSADATGKMSVLVDKLTL